MSRTRRVSEFMLFVGAFIRAIGLPVAALWYDEAWTLSMTRLPLLDMLRLQATDFNPPLWELIAWPFVKLLGEHTVALRLPSLLASLLGLWVVWQIMDEIKASDNQRIFISALVAFLPVGWWVAQDARVYAVMSTLYLLAGLYALRGNWPGLAVTGGLMLYGHNTAPAFLAGAIGLALVQHRGQWRKIAVAGLLALVAYLPWLAAWGRGAGLHDFWLDDLTMSYFVLSTEQAIWLDTLTIVADQWRVAALLLLTVYICIALSVSVSIAMPFIWRAGSDNMARVRGLLRNLGWDAIADRVHLPETPILITAEDAYIGALAVYAVLPVAIMVAASVFVTNVIFYRPLTMMVMPLAIWLAMATAPRKLSVVKLLMPALWAAVLVVGWLGWLPARRGGDLDVIAERVRDHWQSGDVLYYVTGTAALPFDYYLHDLGPAYLYDAEQHPALLQTHLQDAFGWQRASLNELDYGRAWLIWPRDPLITEDVSADLLTWFDRETTRFYGVVEYWQAADIEVYLIQLEQ